MFVMTVNQHPHTQLVMNFSHIAQHKKKRLLWHVFGQVQNYLCTNSPGCVSSIRIKHKWLVVVPALSFISAGFVNTTLPIRTTHLRVKKTLRFIEHACVNTRRLSWAKHGKELQEVVRSLYPDDRTFSPEKNNKRGMSSASHARNITAFFSPM